MLPDLGFTFQTFISLKKRLPEQEVIPPATRRRNLPWSHVLMFSHVLILVYFHMLESSTQYNL